MKTKIQFNTANGIHVRREIDLENLDREHRRLLEERVGKDGNVCQLAKPTPGRAIIADSPGIDSLLVAVERDQEELNYYHD